MLLLLLRDAHLMAERCRRLLGSGRTFRKHGRSGIEVSDLFPHLSRCVDDLAVVRSCYGDMVVHSAAQYESEQLLPFCAEGRFLAA